MDGLHKYETIHNARIPLVLAPGQLAEDMAAKWCYDVECVGNATSRAWSINDECCFTAAVGEPYDGSGQSSCGGGRQTVVKNLVLDARDASCNNGGSRFGG